jgi:hypothetical protein
MTIYESVDDAIEAATMENPPPGQSLAGEDIAVKKGDIIAHYNHWIGIWHVKRVVKASKPTRSYNREIWQPEVSYVSHDAQPEPGKTGASRNHYEGRCGFGQGGTRTFAKDGKFPWYLVDMADPRALDWIAEQDQLWADHEDDEVAEKERVAGTPDAFENRMEARARRADQMADQAEKLAASFRGMAEDIRSETRGQWIK